MKVKTKFKKIVIAAISLILIIFVFYLCQLNAASSIKSLYLNGNYDKAYEKSESLIIKTLISDYEDKIDIMDSITLWWYSVDNYNPDERMYRAYLMLTIANCIGYSEIAESANCSNEVNDIKTEASQMLANAGYDVIYLMRQHYNEKPEDFYPLAVDNEQSVITQISELTKTISMSEALSIQNEKNPLVISDDSIKKDGDYWYCYGTIKNISTKDHYFVEVRVTYYDDNNEVLTTDWTYAVGSEGILPKENQQFEIMTEVRGEPTHYKLEVQDFN
jgi:hypothetical protein